MATSKVSDSLINQLNNISNLAKKTSARLASGQRIQTASDDAAGLAVSEALDAESRVQSQARLNADDGLSISNIADSTLSNVADITSRQSELATQAANGVYGDQQRQAMNDEYQQLEQEKQRQISSAQFNGQPVFNSDPTAIQVGEDGSENSSISMPSVDTGSLTASVVDISSVDSARQAVDDLANKLSNVSTLQGQLGASRNRVEIAGNAATSSATESAAASSRIKDADMAEEVANYTRQNIIQNSGTAMLAQANQNSSIVLSLLR